MTTNTFDEVFVYYRPCPSKKPEKTVRFWNPLSLSVENGVVVIEMPDAVHYIPLDKVEDVCAMKSKVDATRAATSYVKQLEALQDQLVIKALDDAVSQKS
jgi:hypothetical protein